MEADGIMMTVIDRYNGRLEAAAGKMEDGSHTFVSPAQWRLVLGGLDIDYDELQALGQYFSELVAGTAAEHPDRAQQVLADGLQQLFALGAMYEQERAKREASDAA